jgi:uncharacterized protein (DUF488 family)
VSDARPQHHPILTVGYGARDLESFLDLLDRNGVRYLIDVRSRPFSRYKPDFNRDPLKRSLHRRRIRYVFMGDLLGGLPDDKSCYTEGKVDYEKVRARPFHQRGISRLRSAWQKRVPVAVMCACGNPERCHRSKLIGISLHRAGIPVVHVDDHGNHFDQETILMKLNGSPDLFGHVSEAAASRKKYVHDENK